MLLDAVLAIGCALGTGGAVFLSARVWQLSSQLISAKGDLVVEKTTNAFVVAANESLRVQLGREIAANQVAPLPALSETGSTEEAAASIRNSLRHLAGLSVSAAGATQNSNNLPRRDGTVYGPPAARDSDPGDEHPPAGGGGGKPNPRPAK